MLVVASFIGFVAAGQMLVVLVGGIDLSIPWVLNGAAIVLTTTSLGQTSRMPLAIALALGVGAAVGFANGMGVAWLGVPAVVMTLGMNGVMQGLTLGLSKGLTCAVVRVLRARSRCVTCSSAGCSAFPGSCSSGPVSRCSWRCC